MNYQIVGTHTVAGVAPGEVVSEADIVAQGGDPAHLISAGHIVPVGNSRKAVISKADKAIDEAVEADQTEEHA